MNELNYDNSIDISGNNTLAKANRAHRVLVGIALGATVATTAVYGGSYIGTHYDVVSGHVSDAYAEGGPNQNVIFTPHNNVNKSNSGDKSDKNTVDVKGNDVPKASSPISVAQFKKDANGYPVNGSTINDKSGTWKITNVGPNTPISYYVRFGDDLCKVNKSEYNKLSKAFDNDTIVDPMICHRA